MIERKRSRWPRFNNAEKYVLFNAEIGQYFDFKEEYRLTRVCGGWICEHIPTGFIVAKEQPRRALASCFYHVHIEPTLDKPADVAPPSPQ